MSDFSCSHCHKKIRFGPLLLVKPEQMDLERIHHISRMDFASPAHLSRIASDVVRDTLENFTISSQESPSCSSSSPKNDNLNPDPVVLKKRDRKSVV